MIDNSLGKTLTVNEVASYLRVSPVTVRSNYLSLGGFRLGSRYLFFEKSLINAILHKEQKSLDGTSRLSEQDISKEFFDEKGSQSMGSDDKKISSQKSYIEDTHNLID